jgi:hypothetical protein
MQLFQNTKKRFLINFLNKKISFMQSQLTFNKYPFLKELGLQETNLGCYYDKTWVGSGS